MSFADTGLPWVMPSPNMPTPDTALVYPGQCLFEGTNLSEGRGTTRPFEIVGAPFLDGHAWVAALAAAQLPGVRFRPLTFRPTFHKFAGKPCGGVQLHVVDRAAFRPYRTGVALIAAARELGGDDFRWRTEPYEFVADPPAIDLLTGSDEVRKAIERGARIDDIQATFVPFEGEFAERRRPALHARISATDGPRPMRVALYGGSFNPPHVAHQLVALYVLETAPVDAAVAAARLRTRAGQAAGAVRGSAGDVPAGGRGAGAARDRSATSNARWRAPSRTLRTVQRLRELHPEHAFSLVIGATCWRRWRPGSAATSCRRRCRSSSWGGREPRARRPTPLARSRCRRSAPRRFALRLRPGEPVEGLVPRAVLDYIYRQGLYIGQERA